MIVYTVSCAPNLHSYSKQKYLVHLVYPAVGETRDFERAPTGEALRRYSEKGTLVSTRQA